MENTVLIRIQESDRYDNGDIGFINNFNMAYVQRYKVIEGKEKEDYITWKLETTKVYWKDRVEDEIKKFKETLIIASQYIDIESYILDISSIKKSGK